MFINKRIFSKKKNADREQCTFREIKFLLSTSIFFRIKKRKLNHKIL